MDKLNKLDHYRQCIKTILLDFCRVPPANGDIEVQPIFDLERDHYQVVDLGWDDDERVYSCTIHIDIKDGKIWIQRNQTEQILADTLIEMGVPKEDIVLGLQPPYVREYTGLGVA